jgi:hypothetical protein
METKAKTLKKSADKSHKETAVDNSKKAITQKVIVNRELKYIYPKGLTDTLKRKAFRQKVRNTLRKLGRAIGKAEPKDKKKLEQELKEYSVTVLMQN